MKTRCCWTVALVLVAGCAKSDREPARREATPAGQAATPRALQATISTGGWTVSPTGIGSVRTEMTLVQAGRQLGADLALPAFAGRCAFVQPVAKLDSVAFMVVDGRIARVDVTGGRVATAEGARVGDSEDRINTLYAGRVEVQPHKYTAGHYLVVRPTTRADDAYRIIFETDGSRVTSYRAGRRPEVEWVEGCS